MPSRSRGDTRIALVGPAILALAVVGILTAPGCGGDNADQRAGSTDAAQAAGGETQQSASGDKTFHGDGFSFTYPEDWTLSEFTQEAPPDRKLPGVNVRPQGAPETQGVFVIVYDDQEATGEGDLDEAVDEIAADNKGVPLDVPPTPTSVDGLPAVYLAGPGDETTLVFDDTTWYPILGRWLPSFEEEIKQGYDQVVASFQVE